VGGLSVASIVGTLVGAYTGAYGVTSLWVAVGVVAWLLWRAPDHVFDPPKPEWSKSNTQGGGMTDREVALRLAIVDERGEYEEELHEEERKNAEQKANAQSPTTGPGSPL